MSRIVFVLISISLWVTTVNAQVGHQYLHMADISGMYQLHAEMDTSSTITISTTAGIGYLSNSISLGDISNREGATRLIDFGLAHDQLKANNFFNYQNDINFLHLDYKINKSTTIRFGLNYKSHVQVEYSKELFQLLGNGNAQFIGETIPIGAKAHFAAMHQIYGGIQKSFGKFSIGVQAKFISGLNHLKTNTSDISLTTSDDIYQVGLVTDLDIETSKALKYNDVDDLTFEFNSLDFSSPIKNNFGVAIDLGLKYYFSDNTYAYVNVYDIGRVSWSNLSRRYTSNVNTEYEGLDVAEYFETDDEILLIDSLRSLLQIEESLNDYSSNLSASISAGFQYEVNDLWLASLNVSAFELAGSNRVYSTIGAQRKINEFLVFGLTYSNFSGSHSAGLNLGFSWDKLNIRFSTDCFRSLLSPVSSSISTYNVGASYSL